jgi:hypothetical protein
MILLWITSGNNKYRISTFSVVTFPMKAKKYSEELENFARILGILNNAFKPTLDQKSLRISAEISQDISRNLSGYQQVSGLRPLTC